MGLSQCCHNLQRHMKGLNIEGAERTLKLSSP